ncbi:MAG: outer membrane protein assembly factor BamA [Deltaproteobacteria bacterium]|nr:outer membrane protein assembly factor BamA [Deltaproteobacteria bacterium]
MSIKTILFVFLSASLFLFPPSVVKAEEHIKLKEVRIQGNLRVEEDGIRLHIKARQDDPFDPAVVSRDVRSIYRMGFFDDVKAELSPEGVLTYIVIERPYVREVEIQGNSEVSREKIEAALGIRPRTILDRDKVLEGVERVKKLYGEQGYIRAQVDFAVSEVGNNQAKIILDVVEGKRLLIQKISFEGNRTFSDSELKGLMATKEEWFLSFLTNRGVLDRDILTNDLAILSSYYYDHGYINHRIDEPVILSKRSGIEVVIRIEEREQYRVGKVEIGGDLIEEPENLLKVVKLTTGQIFRGSRLRGDIATLSERYADRGFAFAQIEPVTRLDLKAKTVDVALMIKRGSPVYFNRITIAGNTKTRDKVIRREMVVAEQELFSGSKIKESRNALQRTGYFEDVQLTTKKTGSPDSVDLQVDIKEGPTGTFGVGAGFSSGDQIFFNVSVSEQNLFGRGQRLAATFDIGTIRQDFNLSFTEPYLYDSRLSLGVDAFNTRREFTDFTSRRTGFGFRTGYPLRYLKIPYLGRPGADPTNERGGVYLRAMEHMRGGMAYQLSRDKISGVEADASTIIREEQGTSLTSSITPSLSYDTRNHFFTPTEGARSNLSLMFAGLGGDNNFLKFDIQTRWFYPILSDPKWGGDYTLVLGNTLGYGVTFKERHNGQENLPLSERYFPGGINSVRGFADRSLGPRDPVTNDIIGGDTQVVLNTEIRFPLMQKYGLVGVAFFDQGQAFSETESVNPGKFKRSVGFGGRWLSPFGPLQLSLGFALNAEPEDDTSVFGFSLGGR